MFGQLYMFRIVSWLNDSEFFSLRFVPRHEDELELEVDDPLLVEVQAEDYWYEAYNMRTGDRGIFPAYYAIEVTKDSDHLTGTEPTVVLWPLILVPFCAVLCSDLFLYFSFWFTAIFSVRPEILLPIKIGSDLLCQGLRLCCLPRLEYEKGRIKIV